MDHLNSILLWSVDLEVLLYESLFVVHIYIYAQQILHNKYLKTSDIDIDISISEVLRYMGHSLKPGFTSMVPMS